MKSKREEWIGKIENEVEQFSERIEVFQQKLNSAPEKYQGELKSVIAELKDKKSTLENKLHQFKQATEDGVEDLQISAEMAWKDLKLGFNSLKERFDKIF